ncbi:hypothetical protein [Marinilabilia sp.]|uniref:hypothetical protein n=1 Tax=Marinilabilia sp. TaxID=2021252 RepID=UPI0025BC5F25|nr:hypothetical protein [Marinilabilia sp.]
MFLLIVFVISLTFSGFGVAQAEGDNDGGDDTEIPTDEPIAIELLKIREVILRASSFNQLKSLSLPVYVQADVRGEDMVVVVENYEGPLEVEIYGLSGSGSVGEVYSVSGSGVYGLDISQLTAGYYRIELHLGMTTYAGKFSIK